METRLDSKRSPITFAELVSHVPAGSASRPIPKLLYRLRAPLRWWSDSILRTVALESYSLFLHIATLLRAPSLRAGVPIAVRLGSHNLANLGKASSFADACTQGMERLQTEHWTASMLVLQIYAQAFHDGANWAHHNTCSESGSRAPSLDS